MRIEINAGGISGAITVLQFQAAASKHLEKSNDVISAFVTVQRKTSQIEGQTPRLQEVQAALAERVQIEENRKAQINRVKQGVEDFLSHTVETDARVSDCVSQNAEKFYQVNPWLRPKVTQREKKWYDKALELLLGPAYQIFANRDQIVDAITKGWNAAVQFYQEHKKEVDTALLVIGAIAAVAGVIASGGVALVPLIAGFLEIMGATGATALTIATGISLGIGASAIVATAASTTLNVIDVWSENTDPNFQKAKNLMNQLSFTLNFIYSVGNFFNKITGVTGKDMLSNYSRNFDPIYPENEGFATVKKVVQKDGTQIVEEVLDKREMTLSPGTIVDRFGSDHGVYTSPYGTPLTNRSLPIGTINERTYSVFRVLKPIKVDAGTIAPYFGEMGGGTQYIFKETIENLIKSGYLERVAFSFHF